MFIARVTPIVNVNVYGPLPQIRGPPRPLPGLTKGELSRPGSAVSRSRFPPGHAGDSGRNLPPFLGSATRFLPCYTDQPVSAPI